MALAAAYAACQDLAASHYENFPVASRLLPARMHPHIAAVYAFARTADDFADEDGYATAERLARLDDWQQRLRRAVSPDVAEPAAGEVGPANAAASTGGVDPALVFEALAVAELASVDTATEVIVLGRRGWGPVQVSIFDV